MLTYEEGACLLEDITQQKDAAENNHGEYCGSQDLFTYMAVSDEHQEEILSEESWSGGATWMRKLG